MHFFHLLVLLLCEFWIDFVINVCFVSVALLLGCSMLRCCCHSANRLYILQLIFVLLIYDPEKTKFFWLLVALSDIFNSLWNLCVLALY